MDTGTGDEVVLDGKYRVTIPCEARENAGWKPGQRLTVLVKGRVISLVPTPGLDEIIGIAPGLDVEDYRDE